MSDTLKFVPPRVPISDGGGFITREWFLFLEGVFRRVGGSLAPSNSTIDEYLQFDVREADAGEINKRLDEISTQLAVAPDATAAVAQLQRITDELQLIASALQDNTTPNTAELSKRCDEIQTLQAFTK